MRNQRLSPVFFIVGAVGAIVLLVALGRMNYTYCQQNPGGNDFLVHWMGTRMLLKDGISPYSDQTAAQIQIFAYGHPALPGEHELRVAYPLYSVLLFIPFALIQDFTLARAIWMTLLEVSLILLTFFSIRLFQWKPNLIVLALIFLFSLVWYHAVRTIINGNAVGLVALGLLVAFLAIKNGQDEVAGFLFALTTIKPQLVVLVILFVLIWAANRRRWRLVSWFFGTMVILVAVAFLFLPDWIIQNIREILRYPGYNPPGTPGAAFSVWFPAMGNRLGWILSGILVILLLIEWFLAIRRKVEFPGFFLDCLSNPGRQPVDWHPDRSGKFHHFVSGARSGFCELGAALETGWYGFDHIELADPGLWHLGGFPFHRYLWLRAAAKSGIVLSAAAFSIHYPVLDTLVGGQAAACLV